VKYASGSGAQRCGRADSHRFSELGRQRHLAFTLATDKYPAKVGICRTIEFDAPGGQIGVMAVRIPMAHTFTSLLALAK
jgi:hypothetical protein